MIIHSGLKRSTRPPCDFNYGAIVGTRRRHCSLFFFSHNANSNFLFDEVACRRRSRSLQQQSEKASAPLKAPRCRAWRRKEDFLCGSETMRGVSTVLCTCFLAFAVTEAQKKTKGQRLNALFCFSGSPVDKLGSSVHQD